MDRPVPGEIIAVVRGMSVVVHKLTGGVFVRLIEIHIEARRGKPFGDLHAGALHIAVGFSLFDMYRSFGLGLAFSACLALADGLVDFFLRGLNVRLGLPHTGGVGMGAGQIGQLNVVKLALQTDHAVLHGLLVIERETADLTGIGKVDALGFGIADEGVQIGRIQPETRERLVQNALGGGAVFDVAGGHDTFTAVRVRNPVLRHGDGLAVLFHGADLRNAVDPDRFPR